MEQSTQNQSLAVTPPSLPKGGGTLQGLGAVLAQPDSQGNASFSLPLPASAGRGYHPTLSLSYSSSSGNGHFGSGWQVSVMRVTRRTNKGVPGYHAGDEFIGPDGEVLVVARNNQNQPEQRHSHTLQGIDLGETYTVSGYRARIVSTPARMEYWQPQAADSTSGAFWLCYSPDGQIHLLGKTSAGRISGPAGTAQIAEWLLEESLSPKGEHLCYHWRAEDDSHCSADELLYHPHAEAERYLSAVYYGNVTASQTLLLLSGSVEQTDWLFTLLFDYGERTQHVHEVPEFSSDNLWPLRQDCFSRYQYGFEIRTRRLCHQVLMFHRLDLLQETTVTDALPCLISRLIFAYESHESRTQLVHCRLCAHEADGTSCSLPPLEMRYCEAPDSLTADWQPMETLNAFGTDLRWQWVDLQGEGMPGLLYQQGNAWQYRAPQRATGQDADAISYAAPVLLPRLPVLKSEVSLMDVNGDGRLEWVVTAPGLQGYYCSQPDCSWTEFTPLNALPCEFFHPQAMLADIMGAGLPDIALIGPHSVRVYPNQRQGFSPATEAHRAVADSLPLPNMDARTLVAFSDMLGSGQQHLVQIRHDGVTCWPSLGRGHFATPLTIAGFSQPAAEFSPERVWLADTDGSGTTDLIYASDTCLFIYRNLSGNRFAAALELPLPAGVCFDDSCQLAVVDTRGQGGVDVILTVPHMTPRHWRCVLLPESSGLLCEINNNMGTSTLLHYRSSVQFWLDEKAQAADNGMTALSHLPFTFPLLWESEIIDEITANHFISKAHYHHGWYDGRERELRGFSCVDLWDTQQRASGNAAEQSPPALLRSWYHQGDPVRADALCAEFWSQDSQAMQLQPHRFTRFTANGDEILTTDSQDSWWLWRALKGRVLHTELYGLDGSAQEDIPYAVSDYRYQVRLIQPGTTEAAPVVMPLQLEQLSSHYERIPDDPRVSHELLLGADSLGFPLRTISAAWPRRASASADRYPDDLPADALENSYDRQQQCLYLTEKQQNWYHLMAQETWCLGLPCQSRSDVFTYDATDPAIVLPTVLCVEILLQEEGLLKDGPARTFTAQAQVYYTEADAQIPLKHPTPQALVAFTETALLDSAALAALQELNVTDEQLQAAGYCQTDFLFPRASDTTSLWSGRRGYTWYASASQFWRPLAQCLSLLTGKTHISWDRHYCVPVTLTDAAGQITQTRYDWRFLAPEQLIDINNNEYWVRYNALGHVQSSYFFGTENGNPEPVGFTHGNTVIPASSVSALLALKPPLPVATLVAQDAHSWMPAMTSVALSALRYHETALRAARALDENDRFTTLAWQRWLQRQPPEEAVRLRTLMAQAERNPPHVAMITADRYPGDAEQQLRAQVIFNDGAGRQLQISLRVPHGEAYQQRPKEEAGSALIKTQTNGERWAISGKKEYDNKGQTVRVFQPYFLSGWHYVSDSSGTPAFADTHLYDPLGRETEVITAKGYRRRWRFFPWFSVFEDENDLAGEFFPPETD